MEVTYLSTEEIKAGMESGNLDIINGVLSNTVLPIEMKPVEDTSSQNVSQDIVTTNNEPVVNQSSVIDEVEQARLYAEMIAERERKKEEDYQRKLKEVEETLRREKQAKEEMVQRLQQLEQQKTQPQPVQQDLNSDEDDEYVSDYAKRTRQIVEELARNGGANPDYKQLQEELNRLKMEFDNRKEEERKRKEKEEQDSAQRKLFDSIRSFQIANNEFQTSKSFNEIHDEYLKFRKDISYISNAQNIQQLESAIDEYYKGGDIKTIADKNGIKPVTDYDKFNKIMELIDLKDGIKYDPKTGDYIPITDDNGNRIRYRSLDEAYRITNFYDELNKARKQSYKEVSNKLSSLQNAPVTLPNNSTMSFDEKLTVDQLRNIINMPVNEWKNNPVKRTMVEKAFSELGLEPPKVR